MPVYNEMIPTKRSSRRRLPPRQYAALAMAYGGIWQKGRRGLMQGRAMLVGLTTPAYPPGTYELSATACLGETCGTESGHVTL